MMTFLIKDLDIEHILKDRYSISALLRKLVGCQALTEQLQKATERMTVSLKQEKNSLVNLGKSRISYTFLSNRFIFLSHSSREPDMLLTSEYPWKRV